MNWHQKKDILDKVEYPEDIKRLPEEKLPDFCGEVRNFLVEVVSKTGGHLGSNLGVVELTVALHRVFDTPEDLIIWDVGHQSYPHKILTGRKSKLHTIRQKGGLAPFPKREESEYDAFGAGHSSTSISAAVGMAEALKGKKNPPQIVAVIGDGALGGGMVYEALSHAGDARSDILVILNDNKMSISPNVGGMGKYLTRLISSPSYVKMREKGREVLSNMPSFKKFVLRAESHTKGMITPGTLFEELGFEYYGPIDGHDVKTLVEVLSNLKKIKGPKFLHIVTKKGKGYVPAEKDKFYFHAVEPFDPETGQKNGRKEKIVSYSDVFSKWICDAAEKDLRLHGITPAMCSGSGLLEFSRRFPRRYHDVGIAEQHSVTFAAGLASRGQKPVLAIYSSFLQRAYDQLIHDVAIQNMDVLFSIDRAGVVGPDGATHAGSFDLSYLRIIPNLVVAAPSNGEECYAMLECGYAHNGPFAVRYPRERITGDYARGKSKKIEIGKAKILRKGKKLAILAFGTMVGRAQKTAKELGATLVDMRFIKPLDEGLIRELSENHDNFVTIEDNVVMGGAGSAVNESVIRQCLDVRVENLGLPDEFLEHGTRDEILAKCGLDEAGILKNLQNMKTYETRKLHVSQYGIIGK